MSPEGRRLVAAYRRGHRQFTARLEQALRDIWPMLLAGRLASTFEGWVATAGAVVAAGHARSVAMADRFYRGLSLTETGTGRVVVVRPEHDPARTRRLLLGAGPGLIRANLAQGLSFSQAAEKAEYWATGAGSRDALSGGRELLRATSTQDRRAGGWARSAEGDACAFCAMLASRGYVYGAEETAEFQAHRGCQCFAVPAFSRNQALPDNSEQFRQQWNESDGTLQGFRRHLTEVRGDQA